MSFEHLDDSQPFVASAELRVDVERRGRVLRRRRRVGVALGSVMMAFLLVVGATAAYGLRQAGRVHRVDTAESLTPVESLDEPFNILLVGVDGGDGLDGRPATTNSDTILLVRLDPIRNRGGVVSIPRDLWVDIPGTGPAKINAAMSRGGPELLIDTIEANLQLPIHHYVSIDMAGLRDLVDQMGGVEVQATAPLRDTHSGLALEAGCQRLDGKQALGVVRSRYLEVRDVDGRWRMDPMSDLSRIDRQQTMLLLALRELQAEPLDPIRAADLVDVLLQNTQVDESFTVPDLLDLVRFLHDVPVGAVARGVVPVRAMEIRNVSALEPTPDAIAHVHAVLDGGVLDPALSVDETTPAAPPFRAPVIRPCS